MSQLLSDVSLKMSLTPFDPGVQPIQRNDLHRLLNILEAELRLSTGPYLAGEVGLPDFAFVPVVRLLLWLRPDLRDYPLASAWMAELMSRQSVRVWMGAAEALPPVIDH